MPYCSKNNHNLAKYKLGNKYYDKIRFENVKQENHEKDRKTDSDNVPVRGGTVLIK